jgi:glycerol-3-phosphate acyltransferase PlsY
MMATFAIGLGVFVVSYLAGSVPSAYLLTRSLRGVDIRTLGSGNPGAVNVYKHVGPWAGVLVLATDALKGAAVVVAVRSLDLGDGAFFLAAMGAVIGHNWPVFLGFRGGKGIAVIFGVSLSVLPLWTILTLAIALSAGVATRSVVFGIAAGIVALNAFAIATGQGALEISLCLTLSALVVATHYALGYRQVLAAVRRRGLWGLFEVE